jgi:hypothetical protein
VVRFTTPAKDHFGLHVRVNRKLAPASKSHTKVLFVSSRSKKDEEGKILFFFKLDFVNEKGVNAYSVIELAGFKGHLLGFSIPSSETP